MRLQPPALLSSMADARLTYAGEVPGQIGRRTTFPLSYCLFGYQLNGQPIQQMCPNVCEILGGR